MGEIVKQEKEIVVPGEVIATGMDIIPGYGAYRHDENIVANRVGLLSIKGRSVKLIPLSGPYIPKRDDVIIARVLDITMNGWRLDANTPFSTMLMVREATNQFIAKSADLSRILDIGDYISCRVTNVSTQKLVDVSMKGPGMKKLSDGQIIKFSPTKFPRIIGRQGSMVSMIKGATGCYIHVGQNGWAFVAGEPAMEVIAVEAIKLVERLAHTSGLTERVKTFLEQKGLTVQLQKPETGEEE